MPNIGNELIALGMATGLQNAFARGVNLVTIPSMNGDSARGGGLTNRTIYDMNRLADGLIIGPGNLLENGGMQIDLNALKALQVPCMMFSVSYGRIFSQQGELIKRTDSMP